MKLLITSCLLCCLLNAKAQYGDAYHKPNQVDLWRMQAQKDREALDNSTAANAPNKVKPTNRTTISGDYNAYAWSEANSMRRRRQDEAQQRQDAVYYGFHCKSGDCRNGSGTWLLPSGDLFTGSFSNGSPNLGSKARIVYATGATVEGSFRISDRGDYVPVKKTAARFSNGTGGFAEEGADGWVQFTNAAGARVNGGGEEVAGYTGSSTSYCQGNCIETLIPQDGTYTYTGNTLNGMPHGKGEIKWKSGISYAGDFYKGLPDGYGVTKWPGGVVHEGRMKKGVFEGAGTIDYGEGQVFDGEFVNGLPAKGVLKFGSGNVYEGALKNDQFEGMATLKFGSGHIFKGEFHEGKAVYGTMTYKDGGTFTGFMQNTDSKIMPYAGVHEDPGYTYYGYFDAKGKRSGYGYMAYPEGDVLKGKWKDGEISEFGSYVFRNKKDFIAGKVDYKGAQIWGLYNTEGNYYQGKLVKGQIEYLTKEDVEEATKAFTAAQEYLSKAVKEFNAKMAERN